MHYVIICNGIIAMSSAFRLLDRIGSKDKITIVGPRARVGSATLAAGAMLNSFAEIEAGSLSHALDFYKFGLSHRATSMWPNYEDELIEAAAENLPLECSSCTGCNGGGCFSRGTYVVNNTAADQLDDKNYEAIYDALQEFNEPHAIVNPDEIVGYQPVQSARAVRALLIHNEGWFNPRIMLDKHDKILSRNPNVEFLNQNVEKLRMSEGRICEVQLIDGSIVSGDVFLVAAGAATTDIISRSELGLNIQRVFYGVGVSIQIHSPDTPLDNCIRTPNRGLACGLYALPYYLSPDLDNQHILIGASNFISPSPYAYGRLSSVEHIMKGAINQINFGFDRADFVKQNVGWRPASQDGYPMIGRTKIQNLVLATGTKRDGFHMAPLYSEYITKMLLGEVYDEKFDVFSPERPLIQNLSREEAITKSVDHLISAAYQHGFVSPFSKMPSQLRNMYRDELEQLHDKVGAREKGIPPEMIDMYRYGHAKFDDY